jgi:hypothetical protein
LVAPSCVIQVAIVACAGLIFMPLVSAGTTIFRARMERARIMDEGEAELRPSFRSRRAIPGVERRRAALGVGHRNGN